MLVMFTELGEATDGTDSKRALNPREGGADGEYGARYEIRGPHQNEGFLHGLVEVGGQCEGSREIRRREDLIESRSRTNVKNSV